MRAPLRRSIAVVGLLATMSLGALRSRTPFEPMHASRQLDPRAASRFLDLDTIEAGGWREAQFHLINDSDTAIDIARVTTSCPCLGVTLLGSRIEPHQTSLARLRLDLAQEPDFIGGLCPEIEFFDLAGHSLLVRTVSAMVISGRNANRGE